MRVTYRVPWLDEAVLFIGFRRPGWTGSALLLSHLYPPPTWFRQVLT